MCYNQLKNVEGDGVMLSPGPNVFSRPRTTCSYASKSMPQTCFAIMLLGMEKNWEAPLCHTRQKCKQIPSKSGFIIPRNCREFYGYWALCFLLHFHALHVLVGTLHETCWHQRDSQTDKASGHISSMEFLGQILGL